MGFPKGCPCTPASPSLSECNSPPRRRRPNSQGLGQIEAPPPAVHARKNAPKMHAVHDNMDCIRMPSMITWTACLRSPYAHGLHAYAGHHAPGLQLTTPVAPNPICQMHEQSAPAACLRRLLYLLSRTLGALVPPRTSASSAHLDRQCSARWRRLSCSFRLC